MTALRPAARRARRVAWLVCAVLCLLSPSRPVTAQTAAELPVITAPVTDLAHVIDPVGRVH